MSTEYNAENQPLLDIQNLSIVYPTRRGEVRAVDSLYLQIPAGGKIGIVGESGCGKSTALHSIVRLIRPPGKVAGGRVIFKGKDLYQLATGEIRSVRGKEISMVFQDPQTTLNPVFHVGEQIRESLRLHNLVPGLRLPWPLDLQRRSKERDIVLQAMHEVGIPSPKDRYSIYPHQFSGGMQQRALIALALVCNPDLLLADEPTTALDVTIQAQILDLLRQINQTRHTAVILVTHDLGVAAEFCDTITVMYAGRMIEQGPVDEVTGNSHHPYTIGLLGCRPRIIKDRQRISPIPGSVPDIVDLPPGCAFAPRCPLKKPVCEQGPIPLFNFGNNVLSRCLAHSNYERDSNWSWDTIVDCGG